MVHICHHCFILVQQSNHIRKMTAVDLATLPSDLTFLLLCSNAINSDKTYALNRAH